MGTVTAEAFAKSRRPNLTTLSRKHSQLAGRLFLRLTPSFAPQVVRKTFVDRHPELGHIGIIHRVFAMPSRFALRHPCDCVLVVLGRPSNSRPMANFGAVSSQPGIASAMELWPPTAKLKFGRACRKVEDVVQD